MIRNSVWLVTLYYDKAYTLGVQQNDFFLKETKNRLKSEQA